MTTAAASRLLVNDTMSPVEDSIKKLVTKLSNDVYFISRRVCESAHRNFRHRFVVDIVVVVIALIVLLLHIEIEIVIQRNIQFSMPEPILPVLQYKSYDHKPSIEYLFH